MLLQASLAHTLCVDSAGGFAVHVASATCSNNIDFRVVVTEKAKSSYAKTAYSAYELRITVMNLHCWEWLENIFFFITKRQKVFMIFFWWLLTIEELKQSFKKSEKKKTTHISELGNSVIFFKLEKLAPKTRKSILSCPEKRNK